VGSPNHAQKIRCRIPTRGAAADYVHAAAKWVKPNTGVICIAETARTEGEQGMRTAIQETQLQVLRRLDVITRTGLPPRFSIWVLNKPVPTHGASSNDMANNSFPIETMTIRNHHDQTRTLQYVDAMERMGWVDFEQTRQKRKQPLDSTTTTTTTTTTAPVHG